MADIKESIRTQMPTAEDAAKHFANALEFIPANTITPVRFRTKIFKVDDSNIFEVDDQNRILHSPSGYHCVYYRGAFSKITKTVFDEMNIADDSVKSYPKTEEDSFKNHVTLKLNQWYRLKNRQWIVRTDDGKRFYGFNKYNSYNSCFSSNIPQLAIEGNIEELTNEYMTYLMIREATSRYLKSKDKVAIVSEYAEVWVKEGNLEVVYNEKNNTVELYGDRTTTPHDKWVSHNRGFNRVFRNGNWSILHSPIAEY